MQAIALIQAGGVENLRFQEVEPPRPASGEVLVEVRALSVNPADVKLRQDDTLLTAFLGAERPAFLGWDFAGRIVDGAAEAGGFQVGDEVFGLTPSARGRAYAQYVAVPANSVARKPRNVPYEAAAATTMAALTAWNPLVNEARIKAGEPVLIHAGSGGVGHFAIQIAKHFGARVIATCSARNREFVLSLGADQHVDYQAQALKEVTEGVDFVLDTIGGETLARSLDLVKAGGRIITVLPSPSEEVAAKARARNIALSFGGMRYSQEDLGALAGLLERGIVKPHLSATYAFGEMAAAHAQLETGRTVGKVGVVLP